MSRKFGDRKSSKSGLTLDVTQLLESRRGFSAIKSKDCSPRDLATRQSSTSAAPFSGRRVHETHRSCSLRLSFPSLLRRAPRPRGYLEPPSRVLSVHTPVPSSKGDQGCLAKSPKACTPCGIQPPSCLRPAYCVASLDVADALPSAGIVLRKIGFAHGM